MTLNFSLNDPLCDGSSDGSIQTTVGGGTPAYSYNWSNGATSQDLADVVAGSYTVGVTDANGCTATLSDTVTEPSALSLTLSVTDVLCNGDSTGAVNSTVSGGTPPYS